MDLWRISNHPDLSGIGGLRAAGRWHTRGKPIVYLADHPSSALLEMLVHLDRDLVPDSYRLMRLSVPDEIIIDTINVNDLPVKWRQQSLKTRAIGDQWLDTGFGALLQVPSAILPNARNFLLNPAHPEAAQIMLMEIIEAPFDPRLLGEA